jgi:hypothetical protein
MLNYAELQRMSGHPLDMTNKILRQNKYMAYTYQNGKMARNPKQNNIKACY